MEKRKMQGKNFGKQKYKKKLFRKICNDCDEWFQPTGRSQELCVRCQKMRMKGGRRKGEVVRIDKEKYLHLIENTDLNKEELRLPKYTKKRNRTHQIILIKK